MAIKIREGGVWVDILKSASDDTHSYIDTSDPTITQRPDGNALTFTLKYPFKFMVVVG